MELYEHARPELMSGKKILYVHGFASSGASGSVRTLRLLIPQAEIIAPDLPVEPEEAMGLLKGIVEAERPDLVIGTSMGGMYAEMLYGPDRILVNPAFHLADTLLKNNGLGRKEFRNPRKDGETTFLVTKSLVDHFREVSSHCFERASEDTGKVFGLFGVHDTLVDTFDLFSEHYPQAVRFDGAHYLNDAAILHAVLPVVQWIDDRQGNVRKPSLIISLSERLVSHSSGFSKAVSILARSYDLYIVSSSPYNTPSLAGGPFAWCESNLGVPVWNRVLISNHKELLMADYMVDAEPETNGGDGFLGTLIHFGSPAFKTWEDVLTYFSRLGGN